MVFSFWLAREAPGDPFLISYQSQEFQGGIDQSREMQRPEKPVFFFGIKQLDAKHPIKKWIPAFAFFGTDNQFSSWTKKLFSGSFGNSLRFKTSVWNVIRRPFGISVLLGGISTILLVLLSIWLAKSLSLWTNSRLKKITWGALDILYSFPPYWLAILLLVFLASSSFLMIFPSGGLGGGKGSWLLSFFDIAFHLVLPILCLSLPPIAYFTKIIFQNIEQETKKVYTLNATARGFSKSWILKNEVLRNSLIPLLAHIPLFLSSILGGALIIEKIFNLPGMGKLMVDAFGYRDYPVIFGIAFLTGILTLLAFLVTDILYARLSPQLGSGFGKK